jgi:hypothetical protein
MKMNMYNTEIRVETVKDAFCAGRLHGPAGKGMMKRSRDYPIVILYPYARGMSPCGLTIEEAEELLIELETAIKKARNQVSS